VLLGYGLGCTGLSGATVLSIDGDQFTINVKTKFLLGFSYYGAPGAPKDFVQKDLTDFQGYGFNWLRVWATWDAFGADVSAVDKDGSPREPFLENLKWLVQECDRRGLIVDVTLARSPDRLPNLAAYQRAVETIVQALWPHRNWYLDLANERDVRDGRYVPPSELKLLRDLVRKMDPERLVTASFGGHDPGREDTQEALALIGLDFLCPHRPELVAWGKRVYQWIGRTHTTQYGWVADVSGGRICESCAIASRFRLGLALYRAGVVDPFGEIDRHVRNQLLENQFVDVSFMSPPQPQKPRTDRTVYAGVDRMIRGTFQCWGTANDLIGNDDIEGCGAGGGVQGLKLAWDAQSEWREVPGGPELRVHLLFNRALRAKPELPFTTAASIAATLWSELPYAGHVRVTANQPINRLALRLPHGSDLTQVRLRYSSKQAESPAQLEDSMLWLQRLLRGTRSSSCFH